MKIAQLSILKEEMREKAAKCAKISRTECENSSAVDFERGYTRRIHLPRQIRCIRRASDVYAADVYAAYTSAVVADVYAA